MRRTCDSVTEKVSEHAVYPSPVALDQRLDIHSLEDTLHNENYIAVC